MQIAAGKNRLRTKSYNFKGLKNIERKLFGRIYKYYYGNSSSYKAIKESLKKQNLKVTIRLLLLLLKMVKNSFRGSFKNALILTVSNKNY